MAGLVPAIHVLLETGSDKKTWDALDILREDGFRALPGHDG
jgi:hypothetical protein